MKNKVRQRWFTEEIYLPSSKEGFPGSSDCKESSCKKKKKKKKTACNVGDPSSIPGLGNSPGGGNGNPLQYSCLENPMDRGAWRAPVHGVHKESDMTELLTL